MGFTQPNPLLPRASSLHSTLTLPAAPVLLLIVPPFPSLLAPFPAMPRHRSSTSSAEEMFRVFSKFNPLFFRPRIRAAIAEFQADLIKHVREAVHKLQVRCGQSIPHQDRRMFYSSR